MEFALHIPDEMRKRYIERRAQESEALAAALEAGDFGYLASLGHQLRGNAPTFGYETLAELGRKLESAAESKDPSLARGCLLALRAWVQEQGQVGESG